VKELDFEEIFERYHQALYRFCLSILGNPEDAREALQNTMVKALRALPAEEREIQLKPWLYRVAHNESIDLLRRRRDGAELNAELVASGGGPAEEAEVRDRLRTLLGDLRELPERQRAALVMRELAGLGLAEIGEALGTSDAVARQTVYEARLSLQQLKAGREMSCEKVRWELSAEDGRVTRRRDIQAHLRGCAECRAFSESIAARRRDFAAFAPLPAAASASLLHAVLGGKAAGGGVSLAGGALGKVAATSTAVKSVATLAVVAAVAVPVADRSGLVHAGLFDRGSPQSRSAPPSGGDAGASSAPASARAVNGNRTARGVGTAVGSIRRALRRNDAAAKQGPAIGGETTQRTSAGTDRSAGGHDTGQSAREGDLPQASAHGQQTAAAHGGGRGSAGSKGKGHSHAPKAPPSHEHSKPSPPPQTAPQAGGEGAKATPPSGQAPAVPPDKGSQAPLQPPNENPQPPEEAGTGQTKEASLGSQPKQEADE
jgi:RNA polymerase sigma factor (sigma-70 family)